MNVLSLFDGISCGQIALERAGFKVDNYFAAEIDKHAIQVAKANYPNTQHLGDVREVKSANLPPIDLLIGGSPCQGFSSAGKQLNFDDPRSTLFFEFVRLLDETEPRYFLLENVRMKKEHQDVITTFLGVEPILINSKHFSAQNRQRLYWYNWDCPPFEHLQGEKLKDFVKDGFINSAGYRTRTLSFEGDRKSVCLEVNDRGIANCLLTVNLNNILTPLSKGRYVDAYRNVKFPARQMTINEMERLQNVPKGYLGDTSVRKAAKMLGNGWTVDVIAHILGGLKP